MDPQGKHIAIKCQNLWKIFGKEPERILDTTRQEGLSKLEVLKRFQSVVAVANASFEVSSGEVFCIMGLSGSGKSTLIRMINRLIEPTSGHILINGQDIAGLTANELRRLRSEKIGMVFQSMALLPHRTVRENVAFPLELQHIPQARRQEIAENMLSLVALEDWGEQMPHELSGGMQQRVGLARALASDPDFLLLDEPFSALDPLIRRQLQDQFLQISRVVKKTVVFITHDLDEAMRLGDRIAIMKDGGLVQVGTAEEIVTHPRDEYVAEFVQGVSRIKLVSAQAVMESIEGYRSKEVDDLKNCPTAPANATLDHLIGLSVKTDKPIVIVENEKPIGVVTKRNLLRGIQGGQEHDA
ncbi:MAG: glycine betaine/L-proline ABC transporter ATP-binding protein [Candidatus Binatia bacterium]